MSDNFYSDIHMCLFLLTKEPNRKLGDYWNPPDEHGSLVKNRIFFEGLLEEARKSVCV